MPLMAFGSHPPILRKQADADEQADRALLGGADPKKESYNPKLIIIFGLLLELPAP
jgi:hypothetical protein